jgi:hypothetical protein
MARKDIHKSMGARLRSVPHRRAFYIAAIWTVLHLFCVTSMLTVMAYFFTHHKVVNHALFKNTIIIFFGLSLFTLIVSFYKRRMARCPLCLGTPLMNTGALAHKRSFALRPLSHGFTAVLNIACTQKFRCMYCGTVYDLLKKRGLSARKKPIDNPPDTATP